MDMNLRDWLIIFGVLTVLIVIIDAIRRVWLARRQANELNFGLETIRGGGEDVLYRSELPNGGARVKCAASFNFNSPKGEKAKDQGIGIVSDSRLEPSFDVSDSHFGMASDGKRDKQSEEIVSPKPENKSEKNESLSGDGVNSQNRFVKLASDGESSSDKLKGQAVTVESKCENTTQNTHAKNLVQENVAVRKNEMELKTATKVDTISSSEDVGKKTVMSNVQQDVMSDVLIINVVASEGQSFAGAELHMLMVAEGLVLGRMNVFHRYVRPSDQDSGKIYSIANGVEPGFFDKNTFQTNNFVALSFFLTLPGPLGAMDSFRTMVKAAQRIANAMGGILKDEKHCVITQKTLETYRSRVRRFDLAEAES